MSFIQASAENLTVTEGDDTASLVYLKSTLPIACSEKLSNGEVQGCMHSLYINISGKLLNDEILL